MTMDDQHIDGNGVAGLLREILVADPTMVLRTCQSCGDRRPIADHRAYRTAGLVLRCPSCSDVALVVGIREQRLTVAWRGTYEIGR
jgi:hypothetical protein